MAPKHKPLTSATVNKIENSATQVHATETTKSPKSNGAKPGGRRKTQSRSKTALSSSQNIASAVSDDDSDIENGVQGVDKALKNNRRKRNEKEKVMNGSSENETTHVLQLIFFILLVTYTCISVCICVIN